MKLRHLLILTLGLASAVQAATYDVYITGSTAGRASVFDSLAQMLTGETVTKDNATLNSANKANFTGGTYNSDTYNVYCSWSGSAAGVQSVTSQANVVFMAEIDGGTYGTPTALNHVADIAFSDVFQSSTNFQSPTLTDATTVVLPFKFMTSEGSPITNVTPQLAQVLFQGNVQPLALFTGLNADHGKGVIGSGRDNGSGTRITTMAEVGVGAFSSVTQYTPNTTGSNQSISGIVHTAGTAVVDHTVLGTTLIVGQPITGTNIPVGATVSVVNSTTQFTMDVNSTGAISSVRCGQNAATATAIGNNGASSGSSVAGYVAAHTSGLTVGGKTPCYVLGYIGLSDGATALTNGAVECQYNGVTYSATAVYEGRYSLWGYLHMMHRDDAPAGAVLLAAGLATNLDDFPGSSGLKKSLMQVERLADGGNITPLY